MKLSVAAFVLFFSSFATGSDIEAGQLTMPKTFAFDDIKIAKDGPLEHFQIIHGILTPRELKYYRKMAAQATQADNKMIGRHKAEAPLMGNLTARFQALSDNPSCDADEGDPVMVMVTRIDRSIKEHTDILAIDESPMMEHVIFVLLETNGKAWFKWGDHRVPVVENTAMVFRGNTTHQVIVEEGEVSFLGPVGLDSFAEIGYGCQGEVIDIECGESEEVTAATTAVPSSPTCDTFEVKVKCDGNWKPGSICFNCDGDTFNYSTEGRFGGGGFLSLTDDSRCQLSQGSTSVAKATLGCFDGFGDEISVTVTNLDKISSSSSSTKGGMMKDSRKRN